MTRKQKKRRNSDHIGALVDYYGADILDSPNYLESGRYCQHGDTSTRDHMISVACMSIVLGRKLHLHCDEHAMVRGALLHDYFLYDWHIKNHKGHTHHATGHSSVALKNAAKDFSINPKEADIIRKHMFPVNITPPRYRETYIVSLADKICTVKETFSKPFYRDAINGLTQDGSQSNHHWR